MHAKATSRVASLRSGIFVSEEQMYSFYRNFFLLQEAIQKTYSFTLVVLQQFTYRSRAFSLTKPASMQILYWNKSHNGTWLEKKKSFTKERTLTGLACRRFTVIGASIWPQSRRYEKLLCFSTFSNVSPILHHSSESIAAKAIKRVQFKVR